MKLTPVEHDPYAPQMKPVDYDPWQRQELEPAAAPQKRPDLLQDQTMPMLQTMAGEVFPWSQRQYTPPVMDPNPTPGKVGPGEMNALPEAMIDVASNIPSLGAKAGASVLMKGIFAGVGAKTANKMDLKLAEEMLAKGFDKKQIWDATGWFQGKDGQWRFEIPDKNFIVNYGMDKGISGPGVAHPGLREAYDFSKLSHEVLPLDEEIGAYWAPSRAYPGGHIDVGGNQIEESMLHELMHAVQQKEGFARGGSFTKIHELAQKMFPAKTTKEKDEVYQTAREVYNRLAGEVEARNVETRLKMSPEERKRIPPWETEDRPREVQNVRMRPEDAAQRLQEFRGHPNEQQLIEQRIRQIEYDRRLSKVEGEPYPPHAELYALRQRLKELKK